MPNIKSAKKRVLVNEKKTEQNKAIRTAVKTEIKKIDSLVKAGKYEEAKANLQNAFKLIDSACSKNIFHKNNAANKKAKLAKKVSNEVAVATPVAEPVAEPVVAPVAPATEEPVKKPRKPRAKKVADAE